MMTSRWFWLLLVSCAPTPSPGPLGTPAPRASKTSQSVAPVSAWTGHGGPQQPFDACATTPHPFVQPVQVVEDAKVERYPPLIGVPLPFPRGARLASLTGFSAQTVQGEWLATQFEVLSRWGAGPSRCEAPVRWSYAWILGNAPPATKSFLAIKRVPNEVPQAPLGLKLDDTAEQTIIDTGSHRFTIRKDWFNGLSRVEAKTDTGWVVLAEVPSTSEAGMLVLQRSQLASPLHGKVERFEIERRGPVLATVAIHGSYAQKGQKRLFRFVLRLHFFAGTGAVEVDHTYANGDTEDFTAAGAKNVAIADRVYWKIPLALDGAELTARASEKVHALSPKDLFSIQQDKRTPDRPQPVFAIRHGAQNVELGAFADRPFLAVQGPKGYVVATLGHLGFREPQALRYDFRCKSLEIDWQSEAMFVGGARGVWSKAVLDFGLPGVDVAYRGEQLYAHATRRLVGLPPVSYLNDSMAYGRLPSRSLASEHQRFDRDVDQLHARTVDYLRKYRVTGSQLWPDLSRDSCTTNGSCGALETGLFEGGDNNYWDWSLVELEQFVRTADPAFLWDFGFWEAVTMAETISYRTDPNTKAAESSFAGFSPCYGPGRDWDGRWHEGLNHRLGSCPGDYSYNKVHRLAYLLTADRRFTEFFAEGAQTAIRLYSNNLKDRPEPWFELSATRQTAQYLEPLLTAAEFVRDDAKAELFLATAVKYFEFMLPRALERGHACALAGSGFASPKAKGECVSIQQWMLPIFADWVLRLHLLAEHAGARQWLFDMIRQSVARTTTRDSKGDPDISTAFRSGDTDAENGWRTAYRCSTNKSGISDTTCKKIVDWENGNFYYANGVVSYLNLFGIVAELDPEDTLGICRWLPAAFAKALEGMDGNALNDHVWGKSPAQAYAFSSRLLGALERCK